MRPCSQMGQCVVVSGEGTRRKGQRHPLASAPVPQMNDSIPLNQCSSWLEVNGAIVKALNLRPRDEHVRWCPRLCVFGACRAGDVEVVVFVIVATRLERSQPSSTTLRGVFQRLWGMRRELEPVMADEEKVVRSIIQPVKVTLGVGFQRKILPSASGESLKASKGAFRVCLNPIASFPCPLICFSGYRWGRRSGSPFCFPAVSESRKDRDMFTHADYDVWL